MPPDPPFISYARNREDVVLWRALGHVHAGLYVNVSASHPRNDSVTRAFDERGWSGIRVDPPDLSDVLQQRGTQGKEVHAMLVHTEGSEPEVLAGIDLHTFRPWVLVIASTAPNSTVQTHHAWEADLLGAGYRFCLFDGLSRFYVAEEHAETLQTKLAYPACVLDTFVDAEFYAASQGRLELVDEVRRWRAEALAWWAATGEPAAVRDLQGVQDQLTATVHELFAMQSSTSWRVTGPIRALRRRLGSP